VGAKAKEAAKEQEKKKEVQADGEKRRRGGKGNKIYDDDQEFSPKVRPKSGASI